jgi:bifunctional DNase/RNase
MDVSIDGVRVAEAPAGPVPVVLLTPANADRTLPIYIGLEQAQSIVHGQDAVDLDRPHTHDLMLDVRGVLP